MTTNSDTTHLDGATPAARAEAAASFRDGKKTGKQMLGMPIFSLADGDKIGDVHSVVYSAGSFRAGARSNSTSRTSTRSARMRSR